MNNNEVIYSGDCDNVTAITIFDTTGRQVGFCPSGRSVRVDNLQKGMYVAFFNLKNGNNLKLKFIKR